MANFQTRASLSSLVCLGASIVCKTACVYDVVEVVKRVQRILAFTSGGAFMSALHFLTKLCSNTLLKKVLLSKKEFPLALRAIQTYLDLPQTQQTVS